MYFTVAGTVHWCNQHYVFGVCGFHKRNCSNIFCFFPQIAYISTSTENEPQNNKMKDDFCKRNIYERPKSEKLFLVPSTQVCIACTSNKHFVGEKLR